MAYLALGFLFLFLFFLVVKKAAVVYVVQPYGVKK